MKKKLFNQKNSTLITTISIFILGAILLKYIADAQSRVDF